MANITVSVTIPEAQVNRAKELAQKYTSLPPTSTAKELLSASLNQLYNQLDQQYKQAEQFGIT